MTVMNLDQLEVWRLARDFAVMIYKKVVLLLPASEKYNLADQLKRASASIPANIAERHGRFYFQDNVRFCYIARGSLTEVQSHLSLAKELGLYPLKFMLLRPKKPKQLPGQSIVGLPTSRKPKSV